MTEENTKSREDFEKLQNAFRKSHDLQGKIDEKEIEKILFSSQWYDKLGNLPLNTDFEKITNPENFHGNSVQMISSAIPNNQEEIDKLK